MRITKQDMLEHDIDPSRLQRNPRKGGGRESSAQTEESPDSVTFVVPGRPKGKAWQQRADGGFYLPSDVQEYESRVQLCARRAKPAGWRTEGRCAIYVIAYYTDRRFADATNILKAVEDGVDGELYDDDRQNADVSCRRRLTEADEGYTVVRVVRGDDGSV